MNLEQAIKTAIEYETRVRDLYAGAADKATDASAKRILTTLANEEAGHLAYLESRLDEWQKTGSIQDVELESVLPSKEDIEEGFAKLKARMKPREGGKEVDADMELLQRALQVEVETGDFYKRMVKELTGEGKTLFSRFLEIEDGHQAIVQAEIDSVSGLGFWFDTQEFGLERA
jgi:rubrerythrin